MSVCFFFFFSSASRMSLPPILLITFVRSFSTLCSLIVLEQFYLFCSHLLFHHNVPYSSTLLFFASLFSASLLTMSTIPPDNSIDSGSLTLIDTSSPSDARQLYTPFNETAESPNTTAVVGGGEDEGGTQIQVSSTVQTVLIALGIVILVLFLIGIVAAYYISHKNKKAAQVLKKSHGKDMEEGRYPNDDDDIGKQPPISPSESEQADAGQGGGRGGGRQGVCEKGESGRDGESSSGTAAASYVDASAGAGVGRGRGLNMGQGVSRPLTPGSESILTVGNTNRSGPNPFMTPRGSQSGPSGLAAIPSVPSSSLAKGGCAGRTLNKQNSIVDVTQTYSHRQSLLVNPGHPYYSCDSNHSVDLTLPIALVADRAASGNTGGMNRLIDPFTTNNNSNASISVNINMAFATPQTTTEHETRDRVVDTLAIRSPPPAPSIPSSTNEGLPPSSPPSDTPLPPSTPPVPSNDDWSLAPFERRSQGVSRYRASLRGKGKGISGLQQRQHQETPVSVPVVLPDGPMVSNEISYQPPSQPTSPISQYASPTHQQPQKQQPQRSFRNGAAVFEGIPIPRTSIITNNDVIRSRSKAEACPNQHSQVENGHHESEADETVIVSLPSPRGCLLEAEEEFANRFQAYMDPGVGEDDASHGSIRYVEYGIHPQKRGRHHHSMLFQQPFPRSVQSRSYDMDREEEEEEEEEDSKHPEEGDHSYSHSRFRSTMSTGTGMMRSKVKSTYLDDYREQQQKRQQQQHEQQKHQQQQQQQQKQLQDDEGASGIVKAGRRLSTKLQRASFYSTSSVTHPPSGAEEIIHSPL
ncbi:MAG: hypothetical protein J3Q66DRAFT_98932 [Benniella sp.]|nr:MAG: hypothetical protein J3Q66DRAFT_98932 [Benniella sp.]